MHNDRVSNGRRSLFNFTLGDEELDCHVRLGENSTIFMQYVNATSQGSRLAPYDIHELAELVDHLLPAHIVTEDGARIQLLPFRGKDASQTGCKLVQVIQTELTNRTGGKDRNREDVNIGRPRQSKPVTLEPMELSLAPEAPKRKRVDENP